MQLDPYRRVLALPGVRSLMVLALLARIPITAVGVTMTLHVVLDLHRGYAAAGLAGTALTVGAALGAPLNGRFVDRRGLRPMLAITTIAEAIFWVFAPAFPYPALLVAAFVTGLLALPVFSVIRQSIAALVPIDQRRQAYALDSMSVEVSFMAGPTLAVLLVTQTSARLTMLGIAASLLVAGSALFVTNPPVREGAEPPGDKSTAPRRREWLTPQFVAVLAAAMATTMVLAGTDVSIVAILRAADHISWTGAILAIWGVFSLVGGFVYGAITRPVPLVVLVGLLSLFTAPVGLIGGHWELLFVALLPAGALCAPTLTASTDLISRIVPDGARGEAMGWHGSSLTVGLAVGAPLAGWAIDLGSPKWGFVAVGAAGALVTLLLYFVRSRLTTVTGAAASPTSASSPTPTASPTAAVSDATAASTAAAASTASTTAVPSPVSAASGATAASTTAVVSPELATTDALPPADATGSPVATQSQAGPDDAAKTSAARATSVTTGAEDMSEVAAEEVAAELDGATEAEALASNPAAVIATKEALDARR
jgi:MFS family permease